MVCSLQFTGSLFDFAVFVAVHSFVRSFVGSVVRSFGRSVVRSVGRSVVRLVGVITAVSCRVLWVVRRCCDRLRALSKIRSSTSCGCTIRKHNDVERCVTLFCSAVPLQCCRRRCCNWCRTYFVTATSGVWRTASSRGITRSACTHRGPWLSSASTLCVLRATDTTSCLHRP